MDAATFDLRFSSILFSNSIALRSNCFSFSLSFASETSGCDSAGFLGFGASASRSSKRRRVSSMDNDISMAEFEASRSVAN